MGRSKRERSRRLGNVTSDLGNSASRERGRQASVTLVMIGEIPVVKPVENERRDSASEPL
jgi:hypothetical protein